MSNWWDKAPKADGNWWDKAPVSQKQESSSAASGIAKNLGAGIVEGVAAIPTAPRDIGMLAGGGVTYGIDRLRGLTPEQASAEQQRVRKMSEVYEQSLPIPSPLSLIQRGFETYVKPLLPEANTTAEKYARTIGQFAPAAMSPGSALQRAANVVVPAVASEAAGQATEGTSAEPVARLVGGLVGGRLANPRTTAAKQAARFAPTREKLAQQVNNAYDDFRASGATYDKKAFTNSVKKLKQELIDDDLDQSAPAVFTKVDRLLKLPADRITPGLLDKKYSELGRISADPKVLDEVRFAASTARRKIMDILGNTPVQSPKGVTTADISESVKKARQLASSKFKSDEVETSIDVGKWYESGDISGIKKQLTSLGKSLEKSGNMGWSDIELEALRKAAKGDITTNFLNLLGKLGFEFGRSANSTIAVPLFSSLLGGPIGTGIAIAGTAARPAAKMMTRRQVNNLRKVILAGKSGQAAGVAAADAKNADALIRQLIASSQAGLLVEDE